MAIDTPFFSAPGIVKKADSCESLKHAHEEHRVNLVAWSQAPYPGIIVDEKFIPEVRSVGYWDAKGAQSWGLGEHYNEGVEFTFLQRGKTAFQVNGKSFHLEKGDFTITRPWQGHAVGNPHIQPCRLYWMILDVKVRRPNQPWQWPNWLILSKQELDRLTLLLSYNEQPVWQANKDLIDAFEKMMSIVEPGTYHEHESRLKVCINEFLLYVLELLETNDCHLNRDLPTTKRTVELFLEQLGSSAHHAWKLEDMAARCGLSRTQFSKYCKEITNMSPNRYLTFCRLNLATNLMKSKNKYSITDIAYQCGFNSSQYFSTCFQAEFKITPSDYVNNLSTTTI